MKAEEFIKLTRSSLHYITNAEEKLLRYAVEDYAIKDKILKFDKNENAIIQSHLIRWILTNPEAISFIDPYGLRIEGAEIKGNLNLDSVTIPFPLVLKRCSFGDIILIDAETRFLSLEGSSCNSIVARGIRVKGSFRLDSCLGEKPFEVKQGVDFCGANISDDFDCSRGHFLPNRFHNAFWAKHIKVGGNLSLISSYINGETNLSGAKIGGNLDCNHGIFINPAPDKSSSQVEVYALDTSLAEVGGKTCFNSFKVIGHIFALEMKIGGDFDCSGGSIEHKTGNCHTISIDRSCIGGSALLCQGFSATGQVRLIGTKIAGDLDCSGGKFDFFNKKDSNAIYAPRAKIDGSVYLCECMRKPEIYRRNFVTNGLINLELTNIGHSIKIGKDDGDKTSIFNGGGIKLNGAKITNSLEWNHVKLLTEKTLLNLSYATVGSLVIKGGKKSWPNLRLDGLVYDAITHIETEKCNLRLIVASDSNPEDEIIRQFKMAFDSKKNECAVLIVRATSHSEKWTLAGFNDAGEFRTVVIDDPNHKLSKELKKEPRNKRRIVKLAISSLGRTQTEETEEPSKTILSTFAKIKKAIKKAIRSFLPQRSKNCKTHLNWLKKQVKFNPQIYEQLATVLRRDGQDADAKEISIEKEKIRLKPDRPYWKNWNWLRYLWSLILNITIGYGYKVPRALGLSLIIIVCGWIIFSKGYYSGIMVPTDEDAFEAFTKYYTKNHEVPPSAIQDAEHYIEFEPLVYSFDAFLPIGKLQQQEKWHPDGHKKIEIPIPFGNKISFTLRHYLYFVHIPLGWLLTTLGIAGLLQTIARNK